MLDDQRTHRRRVIPYSRRQRSQSHPVALVTDQRTSTLALCFGTVFSMSASAHLPDRLGADDRAGGDI